MAHRELKAAGPMMGDRRRHRAPAPMAAAAAILADRRIWGAAGVFIIRAFLSLLLQSGLRAGFGRAAGRLWAGRQAKFWAGGGLGLGGGIGLGRWVALAGDGCGLT